MAWESRANGGRYYTRSRRVQGRVVREYVGCGLKGEAAAMEDAERRAAREVERAAVRTERERALALNAELARVRRTVDLLTRGALLAAGFERHKRQWRLRHDERTDQA